MAYTTRYGAGKPPTVNSRIMAQLRDIIPDGVSDKESDRIVYARDYWPISLRWEIEGSLPALPDCIVWPHTTAQVVEVIQLARREHIPVIPYGGGSGVMGGTVPVSGGIIVDMKRMDAVDDIDDEGLMVTAQTGINGMNFERHLNRHGYTLGHIPQSLYCSSLGGWLACRAAGQFSTKYGKIEDMVVALEAVLADGTMIRSKAVPRSSTGPQVERLLLGSEGVLGIITKATLRIWPYPEERALLSFAFEDIAHALEAARCIMRKNVYPAVVRIYDENETLRHFYETDEAAGRCMMVLVMEGDRRLVELEKDISIEACTERKGVSCDEEPVLHWLKTRFNVKESSEFVPRGFIFDTVEVSCGWKNALQLYNTVISAMRDVEGVVVASGHASHFYPQGVCFYFTFGGIPPKKKTPHAFYTEVWGAIMRACLDSGGSISHHHGIGITRTPWLSEEMGARLAMLEKIKRTLDPEGIMNPGKMVRSHDG